MNSSWHAYSSAFNFGHRAIRDLLNGEVNVEEKVDGSQFSWCMIETPDSYELRVKSKGAMIYPDAPPAMFRSAVETVKRLQPLLTPGWTYRGEVLCKPKHNALTYDRVPIGNIILFDVNTSEEAYLSYADKAIEAKRLGLEVVPLIFTGHIHNIEEFRAFLDRESVLGGQKIEGVVVKPVNYDLYGVDKKVLFGKFVSEQFREVHKREWGESNPNRNDVIDKLVQELSTPARYAKAVIHLREIGAITDSVKDIGRILGEVKKDVAKEEKDYIAQKLYRHFADDIIRRAAAGVPTWWKDELLRSAFEREDAPVIVEALSTIHTECDVPHVPTEREWMDLGRADDVDEEDTIGRPQTEMCRERSVSDRFGCTQMSGHLGPHRARGMRNGQVFEEWGANHAQVPSPVAAEEAKAEATSIFFKGLKVEFDLPRVEAHHTTVMASDYGEQ